MENVKLNEELLNETEGYNETENFKVKGPSKKDVQAENEKLKNQILGLNAALKENEEYIQRQNKYIDEIFEESNKQSNKIKSITHHIYKN